MQRYGPPPSYPNLKIPGLNAPIPEGCSFGYHAGGWGKPPVDETGKIDYSRVHISSDTAFLKILKKPSIVQELMLPHMNLLGFLHTKKTKKKFFDQPNNKKPKTKN